MLELDIVDEKTVQKGKVTQNQAIVSFKNMAMGGAKKNQPHPAGALDL